MQRRRFLRGVALSAAPAFVTRTMAAEDAAAGREIVLGQSAILSGPLGAAVKEFNGGAKLHFDDVNARGGIGGRPIKLVSLDDELKPDKAVANYKALLGEHKAFAFFGGVGSGTIAAAAAVLKDSHAPLIGNYAVSDAARDKARGDAYFVRATYAREAEKLVQHLATIGITQIALAHLDNPGGLEVLALVRKAILAEGKAKDLVSVAAMKNDGSNVVDIGRQFSEVQPQAVILFIGGPPVARLLSTMWDHGSNPAFYGMSIVAGDLVAKQLGAQLRGLATSQVVPYPWSEAEAAARGFRTLAAAAGQPIGYAGFEGYFNAIAMTEGLKAAGRDLRRSTLHAAMAAMRTTIAGVDLDFTGGRATGSRYVDLVQVTSKGKFLR